MTLDSHWSGSSRAAGVAFPFRKTSDEQKLPNDSSSATGAEPRREGGQP